MASHIRRGWQATLREPAKAESAEAEPAEPAVPDLQKLTISVANKNLDILERTSPKHQSEAVSVLLAEEVAKYELRATLSPNRLQESDHVHYNLVLDTIKDGALASMKIARLKDVQGAGLKQKRELKKGANVLIMAQRENPKDDRARTYSSKNKRYVEGMLAEVSPQGYDVVLANGAEKLLPQSVLQIESSEMLTVFMRMRRTIESYEKAEEAGNGTMRDAFLAEMARGRARVKVDKAHIATDNNLNQSQREAVEYALGSNLCVIKGPPGTGKTKVLYHIIMELLTKGENILICCGSHTAVDNLVQRLQDHDNQYPISRIGHPHRISASTRRHHMRVRHEAGSAAPKTSVRVAAATLHAASDLSGYPQFTTIIIDEVSQTLLAQCWIPLLEHKSARRLIVAGDDKQLSPTVTTQDVQASKTLDITLFDVLVGCYGKQVLHLLDTQYRMSDEIMRFVSENLYDSKLKAHSSVANRRLYQLPSVIRSMVTIPAVLWIDTSILGNTEENGSRGMIRNSREAKLVQEHCLNLQRNGVSLNDIGIISPYALQRDFISALLPNVQVNTIDGFQGQENKVIVFSPVRSNPSGVVGFLNDERRLNVAITRAQYQLCVVGSLRTLQRANGTLLQEWAHWCNDNATIVYPKSDGTAIDYNS